MSATEAKAAARQVALARRASAHGHGLDRAAQARLAEILTPHAGRAIAGYMPIRTELNPLPVMAAHALAGGPVGVPVIEAPGAPLVFRRWTPGTVMVAGAFGALIPEAGGAVVPELVIVPLLAFDRAGGRLGYGGGFYDRTLERLRAARPTLAIGLAYSAQEADRLPLEPTDQPLDAIVTEAFTLTFSR